MNMTKRTQTEQDLLELEAALQSAKRGGPVIWETAQEALERLFQRNVTTLPKNYKPSLDV